jgi:NAD(P)-dependent dehydrogenase (short-subunit alcohol dehydrogenase family)
MQSLENQRIVVVGGSRGLGLGLVEALVAQNAEVTVVARDAERLSALKQCLGVSVIAGDATDRSLARTVLGDVRPTALVLTAGAAPVMVPLHEQTWEAFDAIWQTDVKSSLFWTQEALRLPLAPGSRVVLSSSGAALNGSPLSGGYAGAKRMIWIMANYANGVASELALGIRFHALVLRQMIGETELGRSSAEAYARRKGITLQAFLDGFGKPMSAREFGEHVVGILRDPKSTATTAFGLKSDTGVVSLDG